MIKFWHRWALTVPVAIRLDCHAYPDISERKQSWQRLCGVTGGETNMIDQLSEQVKNDNGAKEPRLPGHLRDTESIKESSG